MIGRDEILRLADELGLRPDVVEKDYMLGWMLAGISQDEALSTAWVFKGGTCLKKCYFETYRFSEDLDFTITDAAQLDRDFLIDRFTQIGQWIYDQTGIEIPASQLRFDVFDTKRGSRAGEGRVSYRGPLMPRGDLPRIRLDLTADELLVRDAVQRPVVHPYSDVPEDGIEVQSYAFDEVFGEKIRALGERSRPRDLYDVINLHRNSDFPVTARAVREVVERKCAFKSIAPPSLESLAQFQDELPGFFEWLAGTAEPIALPAHPKTAGTELIRATIGAMGFEPRGGSLIETIRFAAANRLCVNLDYRDEEGRRSTRVIEPYSLRRTQAGDILLMAVRADSGQPRSYRTDRMIGAQATNRTFTARYPVELTPAGPLSVPDSTRSVRGAFDAPGRGRLRAPSYGPTYIFRCTVCGRQFERKTHDATLRPHKDRSGRDCYGRYGTLVRTK